MTDLYQVDGAALRRIRERRALTPENLASMARCNPNLIYRLEDPENFRRRGIAEERKDKATYDTIYKLARALNIERSYLVPDLPKDPPPPKAPVPALDPPPKSKLAQWRGRDHIRNLHLRRVELQTPELEEI